MMTSDPAYEQHPVFNELDRHIKFYDRLAHSVFLWVSQGTRALCGVDSYVLSSIQGTLASIQTILRDGRVNDAYALLRKYYDSTIISIYSIAYLEDHFSIHNFIVEQIDNWLSGKAQLPAYQVMWRYITSSSRLSPITDLICLDDRYRTIRNRCNDHTHYNFYRNVLLNDGQIYVKSRGPAMDQFLVDLRDLLVQHAAYLFFLKDNYMMSSDHRDALECGMTPEPDSEYWVADFVQEFFDETLEKHRPDLAAAVRNHTSMQLTVG